VEGTGIPGGKALAPGMVYEKSPIGLYRSGFFQANRRTISGCAWRQINPFFSSGAAISFLSNLSVKRNFRSIPAF
jgi:hypothetical protein